MSYISKPVTKWSSHTLLMYLFVLLFSVTFTCYCLYYLYVLECRQIIIAVCSQYRTQLLYLSLFFLCADRISFTVKTHYNKIPSQRNSHSNGTFSSSRQICIFVCLNDKMSFNCDTALAKFSWILDPIVMQIKLKSTYAHMHVLPCQNNSIACLRERCHIVNITATIMRYVFSGLCFLLGSLRLIHVVFIMQKEEHQLFQRNTDDLYFQAMQNWLILPQHCTYHEPITLYWCSVPFSKNKPWSHLRHFILLSFSLIPLCRVQLLHCFYRGCIAEM